MNTHKIHIDNSWTLFLDRDGVINKRKMGGYIETPEEFQFLEGVKETIASLRKQFGKIFVVTNQQGIGKSIMTHYDLKLIHQKMCDEIKEAGGRIDNVYYAPQLASDQSNMRKPNIGMAEKAQNQNPIVDFKKSIMVGDTDSDIIFGKNAGMITVFVQTSDKKCNEQPDFIIPTLKDITTILQEK